MFAGRVLLTVLMITTALPSVAMAHPRRGPTSHRFFKKHSTATASTPKRMIGQRSIDDGRATEIQTALIRFGYLSGQASGHWDAQTEAAMQKYQSDNGWQTKLIPDSRAIIKLGLGPSHDSSKATAPASSELSASTSLRPPQQ
ncbi:peptidoglycan-binding domain-containing protein [Edaphobacter bradus]|uniref:peptidoglycan-binding domain-containing protein n=1 Tax=Edaphobacter bradus TaxID=2259016 RepID=UPI0021DFA7B6|nr:peptidoglycan-binding domain-containing protein [Edaphobacter bradus]